MALEYYQWSAQRKSLETTGLNIVSQPLGRVPVPGLGDLLTGT
jgi:hypothetical protein